MWPSPCSLLSPFSFGHTVFVSQRLSPLIYFSSYLINKELETLSNCHLPKVTQLVSGGLGLGSLLDGIQLEGRRSGEVSLATQGHSNGCLPMGHATFTHGTQSSPRTRTVCPFTSALPRGSLGQAGTLTVGLGWAIQPGCVDQAKPLWASVLPQEESISDSQTATGISLGIHKDKKRCDSMGFFQCHQKPKKNSTSAHNLAWPRQGET